MRSIDLAQNMELQSIADSAHHSLPRRRDTSSAHDAQLQEREVATIGNLKSGLIAVEAVQNFVREMDDRIQILATGKGGPLYPRESVFAVQSPWVYGYLDLLVDEQRGEVRRCNFGAQVCFEPDSVAWTVFLAAWNGGESGCSHEIWDCRGDLLQDPITVKAIRRNVNQKLSILRIRLEPRRLPRLIVYPSPRK